MRSLLVALVALLAGCTGPLAAFVGDPAALPAGIVVSSNPVAAAVGAQVLRDGGNAVDAAAAVQFALAVVEPHFSGLGGGTFIVYRAPDGTTTVLDGRETAPAAATRDQFLLPGVGTPQEFAFASTRGYAVGVPGAVAAWSEAVERWGRKPFADAVTPAIPLAEDGYVVDAWFARRLADDEEKLRSWPPTARVFVPGSTCAPDVGPLVAPAPCVGGAVLAEGALLRQPDLARTLRLLADEGARVFYDGEVAAAIVSAQMQRQGRMTLADLAGYKVVEREPIVMPYRGLEVVTAPAPSGGLILSHMLGLLDGFDVAGASDAEALHLQIEAMRLGYADRNAHVGDPDHVDVPAEGLLSAAYLAQRRALMDVARANTAPRAGDPWKHEGEAAGPRGTPNAHEEYHTSHLLVVDGEGGIVSATTTIESGFGTGMVVPGYGFFLNNELTDFDFTPGGPNEVGPDKRPRSSMAPTIVLRDGAPWLVVGASGGGTITTSVMQVIVGVVDRGRGVEDAVRSPRVFGPNYPVVLWDRGLAADLRAELEAKGHDVADTPRRYISQVQAAHLVDGRWVGAADDRAAAGGVAGG